MKTTGFSPKYLLLVLLFFTQNIQPKKKKTTKPLTSQSCHNDTDSLVRSAKQCQFFACSVIVIHSCSFQE